MLNSFFYLSKLVIFTKPLKRDSYADAFCEYCKIFKNTYFEEHRRTAPSALLIIKVVIKYWAAANPFYNQNNVEWFLL